MISKGLKSQSLINNGTHYQKISGVSFYSRVTRECYREWSEGKIDVWSPLLLVRQWCTIRITGKMWTYRHSTLSVWLDSVFSIVNSIRSVCHSDFSMNNVRSKLYFYALAPLYLTFLYITDDVLVAWYFKIKVKKSFRSFYITFCYSCFYDCGY